MSLPLKQCDNRRTLRSVPICKAKVVNPFLQKLKDRLVQLGPRNPLLQSALAMHAGWNGFRVTFTENCIHIRSSDRLMILRMASYVEVPIMMECFDLFFTTMQTVERNGLQILDFSEPGFHRYVRHNVGFYFPGIPEDDSMDAYFDSFVPRQGDVVWDVGAHAGATSFFLSKFVGSSGTVFAFEPDELNYEYLVRNIALHSLTNVSPVKKAVSGVTGYAEFNMDGTMSAGLRDFLVYSGNNQAKRVETITIADACAQFGSVPSFIKMDIEGAEVEAVRGSAKFLENQRINFSIESYHRVGNEYTYVALERIFPQIGYKVHSSDKFGQMFTWANPVVE